MLLTGVLFPGAGDVIIGDTHVSKKSLSTIRSHIGMVFQNPDDQLFMPTVYDDVAFGPRNYKLTEDEVDVRVKNALETMGISHLSDKAPFKLSGGEKRSVSIACVLSMQPDVLVMDEPTAALDPKSRRRVIDLLGGFEHTKIITSHDLDMIYETCKRVILVRKGKIVANGPALEILSNAELLDQCGLEIPLSFRNCPVCGLGKKIAFQN
jgi:cobalt/nickel transport system ATP-binding protein